ncbi:hypothetical protein ASG43_03270 [Aureimonas sp. Leaf454]|uniref:hypothetical protein n=1 Tax=Aureimonas sp. Leaf454 TaxID=1736381 RepID=UPI0006F6CC74|nr:hypothetical protein [Aureimonas sp. Leaf454]KQT54620.1 hypothetical protein ASG43_03270 [Aureimonas sp. Leaf454]
MLKFLVVGIGVLAAGPAWAGCANYTDGSVSSPAPRAEVCFKGKCEQTTLNFSCSNAYSSQVGFANGWELSYRMDDGSGSAGLPAGVEDETAVSRNGKKVSDTATLVCRPVDEAGCDGFPL